MYSAKILILCIVLHICFLVTYSQYRYDCFEKFCETNAYPCPEMNCENGRLIENATQCGCCHICVEQLKEGETCKTQVIATFPRSECGPGLMCNKLKKQCVPMDTKCIKNRIKYDNDLKFGNLVNRKSRPECDEFGFYKSIVCESDLICYCVDKNGKRIFGLDLARNKDSMNCQCSRAHEEFPKRIPTGDFLRCMPNGNYDSLQCTEKWCYCMADSFHIVGTVVEANTTIKDLLCYDTDRHKYDDSNLRSKCWHERNNLLNQMKEYEKRGVKVIGVDLPECDLDGSYAPVQCKKDKCFCVKKNGDLYSSSKYKIRRSSKAAKEMTCTCVREKELLFKHKDEERIEKFFEDNPCDINGNYRQLD